MSTSVGSLKPSSLSAVYSTQRSPRCLKSRVLLFFLPPLFIIFLSLLPFFFFLSSFPPLFFIYFSVFWFLFLPSFLHCLFLICFLFSSFVLASFFLLCIYFPIYFAFRLCRPISMHFCCSFCSYFCLCFSIAFYHHSFNAFLLC